MSWWGYTLQHTQDNSQKSTKQLWNSNNYTSTQTSVPIRQIARVQFLTSIISQHLRVAISILEITIDTDIALPLTFAIGIAIGIGIGIAIGINIGQNTSECSI